MFRNNLGGISVYIAVLLGLVACPIIESFTATPSSLMFHRENLCLPAAGTTRSRLHSMSEDDSSPSDTSSDPFYDDDDDVVTVESEQLTPTESDALANKVLDLIAPTSVGASPSEGTRAEINEVLLKLEALNPTPQPAVSPLLNGVWELRYAGLYASKGSLASPTRQLALFLYSGGYSPGLFALQLANRFSNTLVSIDGSVDVTICREAPRVEAQVKVKTLLGGESSVRVKSNLEVASDIRLRETYESATLFQGQIFDLPPQLQYTRELYVTYVDEDLLIIRDGSGVPELLIRKEKSFTRNWGTDP